MCLGGVWYDSSPMEWNHDNQRMFDKMYLNFARGLTEREPEVIYLDQESIDSILARVQFPSFPFGLI